MKKIFLFLLLTSLSCNDKHSLCDKLAEGSFDLYENDVLIGKIFRKDNIQIEKYSDDKPYTIVRFERKNACQFHLKQYNVLKPIDTITWLAQYRPLGENIFEINARAAYIDTLDYEYRGKVVKISDELIPEINQLIEELLVNQ